MNNRLVIFPPGTMHNGQNQVFRYKAFRADEIQTMSMRSFNWKAHIDSTFYKCMSNTTKRFMEVV